MRSGSGALAEGGGPASRRQVPDQALGMSGHAEQDVLQVIERRDVHERAALNQRVQEGRARGAFEATGEEPVLPADRDPAQLILGAGMPSARLCRALRMRSWIDPISAPTIVADAA